RPIRDRCNGRDDGRGESAAAAGLAVLRGAVDARSPPCGTARAASVHGDRAAGLRRGVMAARTRSIRLKIFALLLVPLISMVGLWSFATSSSYEDAIALRNYETLSKRFGGPAQSVADELAEERLRSVVWLSGLPNADRGQLDTQRARSDGALDKLRSAAAGS